MKRMVFMLCLLCLASPLAAQKGRLTGLEISKKGGGTPAEAEVKKGTRSGKASGSVARPAVSIRSGSIRKIRKNRQSRRDKNTKKNTEKNAVKKSTFKKNTFKKSTLCRLIDELRGESKADSDKLFNRLQINLVVNPDLGSNRQKLPAWLKEEVSRRHTCLSGGVAAAATEVQDDLLLVEIKGVRQLHPKAALLLALDVEDVVEKSSPGCLELKVALRLYGIERPRKNRIRFPMLYEDAQWGRSQILHKDVSDVKAAVMNAFHRGLIASLLDRLPDNESSEEFDVDTPIACQGNARIGRLMR